MKSYCILTVFVAIAAFVGISAGYYDDTGLMDGSYVFQRLMRGSCDSCPKCPRSCGNSANGKRGVGSPNLEATERRYQSQGTDTCSLDRLYNLMPEEDQERIIETFINLL